MLKRVGIVRESRFLATRCGDPVDEEDSRMVGSGSTAFRCVLVGADSLLIECGEMLLAKMKEQGK